MARQGRWWLLFAGLTKGEVQDLTDADILLLKDAYNGFAAHSRRR